MRKQWFCRIASRHCGLNMRCVAFRPSSKELPSDFHGKDPVRPTGVTFALRDCRFPTPGVYLVQFFFEDEVICQHSLIVR